MRPTYLSSPSTKKSYGHNDAQRGGSRTSGLPGEKTFRTFQWSRLSPQLQLRIERLKSGSFLESATNVIAVGKPGVGKSHLAAALGHELILAGHPVLWCSTAGLVQRLLAAKR